MKRLYMDTLSTTRPAPEVVEAMMPYLRDGFGLPSSAHQSGKRSRKALEQARSEVQAFLKAAYPEEVVFTSSGSEALQTVIQGVWSATRSFGNHMIHGAIDHPTVWSCLDELRITGEVTTTTIRVDSEGFLDKTSLVESLREGTLLLCVQLANPDLGTVQRVREIVGEARSCQIPVLIDATAAAGWVDLSVEDLPCDYLCMAPHRFFGPRGVGILYRRSGTPLHPLLRGGAQEFGLRAGTENLPAIVGAGKTCELAKALWSSWAERARLLRTNLLEGLAGVEGIQALGPLADAHRLPHQLALRIEGVEAEGLVLMANMKGLECHAGSGCLSPSLEPNHAFKAIGLTERQAREVLTLGIDPELTEEDMALAAEILCEVVPRFRENAPADGLF